MGVPFKGPRISEDPLRRLQTSGVQFCTAEAKTLLLAETTGVAVSKSASRFLVVALRSSIPFSRDARY